jgi:RNA polymerase sigma-70 factor, ECF subfamily
MEGSAKMSDHAETFEAHRARLFSIAYRMLGSVMEAEDVVQEAYLRFVATPVEEVRSPRAFLTTVTTRLCLDQLKSARAQREHYIGPWLPEPLLTAEAPAEVVDKHELISLAFLVLLESLAPLERAVFLLREVFEYDYAEIAGIVDKSEANCRQLYHRAKGYLTERRPRFTASREAQAQLLTRFIQAVGEGDVEALTTMLAEEVTVRSDGGGKARAATRPVTGRERAAKLLAGFGRFRTAQTWVELAEVNGDLAILLWEGETLIGVMSVVSDGEQIFEVQNIVNPDKLRHLAANKQ